MDYEDLKYKHKENCKSKDSRSVERKNVVYMEGMIIEYDAYCSECGEFLYSFQWGYYES